MITSLALSKSLNTGVGGRPKAVPFSQTFGVLVNFIALNLNPKTCYTDWCESWYSHPFPVKKRECREKVRRAEIPGNGQIVDSALGESFAAQRGWTC
jgi:hypothetical protein